MSNILVNVTIAIFIIASISITVFIWFKDRFLKFIFGEDFQKENAQSELVNISEEIATQYVGKLFENFPRLKQEKIKSVTPKIVKLTFWTLTRNWALRLLVTIFVAIGGLLGTILLYNQNQLLSTQNERINIQNNLIEAERRSSLIFLMSNVLDKVDEEIKVQQEQLLEYKKIISDSTKYNLSSAIIGRIIALSKAFIPYQILQKDSLSKELVSPERGQLFIALASNNFDSNTSETILRNTDFSYAVLTQIKFPFLYFPEVKLQNAILSGSNFELSNLSSADLSKANMDKTVCYNIDLSFANLYNASLKKSRLDDSNLLWATLSKANLEKAILENSDLRMSNLSYSNLKNANLSNANLGGADLSGADLTSTNLSGANLFSAFFSGDIERRSYFNTEEKIFNENGGEIGRGVWYKDSLIIDTIENLNISHSIDQLIKAKTLFKCKNLALEIRKELELRRPCLFVKQGCD